MAYREKNRFLFIGNYDCLKWIEKIYLTSLQTNLKQNTHTKRNTNTYTEVHTYQKIKTYTNIHTYRVVGAESDGVEYEAVLIFLHLLHLMSLICFKDYASSIIFKC